MTIFLTGATGFLGRAVLPKLLARGHCVVALCRQAPPLNHERLRIVSGDFGAASYEELVPWEEVDTVAHLAASGVKSAHRVWADALLVNVLGTQRLLDVIRRRARKVPRFLATRTFYEHLVDRSPALLDNPYIATKTVSSELIKSWGRDYAGPVVMATVFQLFGPGDAAENVLSYAARQMKAGGHATFGSGRGLRDWLHIEDAAEALVTLLDGESPETGEFDIGSGRLTSIRQMVEKLATLAGRGKEALTFDPARDRPDVEQTLQATRLPGGWTPRFSLEEGLNDLLKHS